MTCNIKKRSIQPLILFIAWGMAMASCRNDELDEFPVNCHFNQINVLDAIMAVIGHYPVKVTIQGQYVFVECVEKRQAKVRGRVLDVRSAPLPNANITI